MSAPITQIVSVGAEYDYEQGSYLENPQLKAAEWREAKNLDILLTNGADKEVREEGWGFDVEDDGTGFGLWDKVFWGHDGYWRQDNEYYIKLLLETVEVLEKHKVPFKINALTRHCYNKDWAFKNIEECKKFNGLFGVLDEEDY